MAYQISEDCISCGACEAECPSPGVISKTESEPRPVPVSLQEWGVFFCTEKQAMQLFSTASPAFYYLPK